MQHTETGRCEQGTDEGGEEKKAEKNEEQILEGVKALPDDRVLD